MDIQTQYEMHQALVAMDFAKIHKIKAVGCDLHKLAYDLFKMLSPQESMDISQKLACGYGTAYDLETMIYAELRGFEYRDSYKMDMNSLGTDVEFLPSGPGEIKVRLDMGVPIDYIKVDINFGTDLEPKSCAHQWRRYHGLIEEYDYCTICDEKRK